uniref:START domain-containing protein n=1 Tax=Chromera velia CCMP2878 TaxID=1169474 RepID=A0A0G4GI35_9ALVE|eukprot:Cvel_21994.t1-p1 / transcript=Cvel_21994.t1 / gene=Cvel_21994 / organism=Chromera_velia_CCMP2878 / gene_product=hypothetical protein / transcript_product=hypothetical protein / location=Cvel_scaffold2119:7270-9492(+) / protein_length=395 / sequence_SO=supercontig / SO=protein_coding / is_pseudo=false
MLASKPNFLEQIAAEIAVDFSPICDWPLDFDNAVKKIGEATAQIHGPSSSASTDVDSIMSPPASSAYSPTIDPADSELMNTRGSTTLASEVSAAKPTAAPSADNTGRKGFHRQLTLPDTEGSYHQNQFESYEEPNPKTLSTVQYYLADKIKLTPGLKTALENFHNTEAPRITAELSAMASDTDKAWKEISHKNGVRIDRKKHGMIVRGSIEFSAPNMTPHDALHSIWAGPMDYNDMAESSNRLITWREGWPASCFYYLSFHGQFGFPGRDFLMAGTLADLGDSHAVLASASFQHPELDHHPVMLKGRVRAHAAIGGYDCRRLPNGKLRLTAIWQLDLKVPMAPDFIVKQLQAKSVHHLENLVARFTGQEVPHVGGKSTRRRGGRKGAHGFGGKQH